MPSPDSSDTQGPVFWERLRAVFSREQREHPDGEKRRRLVALTTCFLISCFLWTIFTLRDTHTVPMTIATEVENNGGAQALTELPPPTVSAQIEGEGIDLLSFYFDDPRIRIGSGSGEVQVSDLVQTQLPRGTRLQSVSPAVLQLQREPRLSRRVPVRLRGRVRPAPTHDLMNEPQLRPDSIQISGARSLVSGIDAWPTEPFTIESLRDSLHRRLPLSDTLAGLVARNSGSVVLTALAREFVEGMRQVDVRVTGGPVDAVTLDPSSIRVQYRTLVEDYQRAQETDAFYAVVPYERILDDTTGSVTPRVQVPADLTVRDVQTYPPQLQYFNFVADE